MVQEVGLLFTSMKSVSKWKLIISFEDVGSTLQVFLLYDGTFRNQSGVFISRMVIKKIVRHKIVRESDYQMNERHFIFNLVTSIMTRFWK